jgi:hypothetical protein
MVTPFTVAAVPTGMKRGVSTTPWGVWKWPQRARLRGQWAVIEKWKGGRVGEDRDTKVGAPPRAAQTICVPCPSFPSKPPPG